MTELTMSKGEFADLIGVSAGRISQYIRDDIIGPDALVGDGRYARLRVNLAIEQIRLRRDPGQASGLNGIRTKLEKVPEPDSEPASVRNGRSAIDDIVARHSEYAALWPQADPELTREFDNRIDGLCLVIYRDVSAMMMCTYPRTTDEELEMLIEALVLQRLRVASKRCRREWANHENNFIET